MGATLMFNISENLPARVGYDLNTVKSNHGSVRVGGTVNVLGKRQESRVVDIGFSERLDTEVSLDQRGSHGEISWGFCDQL